MNSLHFLGHTIDRDGIRPLQNKISPISQFPRPTSLRELHRFIPHCAQVLQPLHTLLSNTCKNTDLQCTCTYTFNDWWF